MVCDDSYFYWGHTTFKMRINICQSSLYSKQIFIYIGNDLRSTGAIVLKVKPAFANCRFSTLPSLSLKTQAHAPNKRTITVLIVSYSYALLDWSAGVGGIVATVLEKAQKKSGNNDGNLSFYICLKPYSAQNQEQTII